MSHRSQDDHIQFRMEKADQLLTEAGYVELGRKKKDEVPPDKSFRTNKQHGLENIVLTNGGQIDFRTRT